MKNKLIASGLAGLALLGGSVAFALGTGGVASATDTAQSTLTQDSAPHGVRGWFHEHRRVIRAEAGKTIASTIGISTDELRTEFKAGKSVSEIATAHQVDPQAVVTALTDQANARIDQAVTNGKLTQQQADKVKARVSTVVGKVMDHHRGDHRPAAGN
jgi:ribosomal protein S20